jgi:putative DNA primase/helicase
LSKTKNPGGRDARVQNKGDGRRPCHTKSPRGCKSSPDEDRSPDPIEVARSYVARGWNPVAVPWRGKGKAPSGNDWPKRVVTDENVARVFNGAERWNVGVQLGPKSSGLTDVDLDCKEAIALAPHFLPNTSAVFGRKTKPMSHWLYRIDDAPNRAADKYDDGAGSTIIELRIGGGDRGAMTVFPGSTHKESEEPIEWGSDGEPARSTYAILDAAVRKTAAASIFLRGWPDQGTRHSAGLAIGGLLARVGWSSEDIGSFVESIVTEAEDGQVADRLKAAEDAAEAVAKGESAYGLPKLKEIFGDAAMRKVAKLLRYDPQEKSDGGKIILVRASDVVIRQQEFVWQGHLARGGQELMAGMPGAGKSQIHNCLIACATTGRAWPDGTKGCAPMSVIMMTAEDALDTTIVPRLIAAGADLNRVHIIKKIQTDDKDRQFLLGEDLEELERAIAKIGDVGLVTIDPITAYMGGKLDSHKATEVRSQLGPLKDFAERTNTVVSTITHPAKSHSQRAIDHFIGSQAFIAACRVGHVCIPEVGDDGEPTGRTLYAQAKNNLAVKMPTLAYRIEEEIVRQDQDGIIKAPRVVWEKESVDTSADEAIAAASHRGGKSRKKDEVVAFLEEMTKDGPVPRKDVDVEGAKRGFTPKQIRTARENSTLVTFKEDGSGLWMLAPRHRGSRRRKVEVKNGVGHARV